MKELVDLQKAIEEYKRVNPSHKGVLSWLVQVEKEIASAIFLEGNGIARVEKRVKKFKLVSTLIT
jgi:hypothetical protein